MNKTNISESIESVTKLNNMRGMSPLSIIKHFFLMYNTQVRNILTEIVKSKEEIFSTTGMRIGRILLKNNATTLCFDQQNGFSIGLKFIEEKNRWLLKAKFPNKQSLGTIHTVYVEWDKKGCKEKNNYHLRHTCDKHIRASSQYLFPCECVDWLYRWINLNKLKKIHHGAEWPFNDKDTIVPNFYPHFFLGKFHKPKISTFMEQYKINLPSQIEVEAAITNANLNRTVSFDVGLPDKYRQTLNREPIMRSTGDGQTGVRSSSKKRRKCEGAKHYNDLTKANTTMTMSNILKLSTTSPKVILTKEVLHNQGVRLSKHEATFCGERRCSICKGLGHNISTCPLFNNISGSVHPAKTLQPGNYSLFSICDDNSNMDVTEKPVELTPVSNLSNSELNDMATIEDICDEQKLEDESFSTNDDDTTDEDNLLKSVEPTISINSSNEPIYTNIFTAVVEKQIPVNKKNINVARKIQIKPFNQLVDNLTQEEPLLAACDNAILSQLAELEG